MAEIGIITEQGDLGLGFDPLNKKDAEAISESVRGNKNKKEDSVITEESEEEPEDTSIDSNSSDE